MARGTYSGRDIIKALGKWKYKKVGQKGAHVKLQYVHPDTGEKRVVIAPLHDELDTGTLKSIADQAGAEDFRAFRDKMDKMV